MLFCIVFVTLVSNGAASNSYLIFAPKTLHPGINLDIGIHILHAKSDVSVKAELVEMPSGISVGSIVEVFKPESTNLLKLHVPDTLTSGSYRIQFTGTDGLFFAEKADLQFLESKASVNIQTDKGEYKAGQTINFRVFALYPNLTVYHSLMDIDIQDPNDNLIKQWRGVSDTSGVYTDKMVMDTHPVLGTWKLNVKIKGKTTTKTVVVSQYVLPTFEVSIELPSYVLMGESDVHGTVQAMYTYGKPVTGCVNIEAGLAYKYDEWSYSGWETLIQLYNISMGPDGKAKFIIPLASAKGRISTTHKLVVVANVTESLTRITLSNSAHTKFADKDEKLQFLKNTKQSFKPGFPYTIKASLTRQDTTPIKTANPIVILETTLFYKDAVPSSIPTYYYGPATLSTRLADKHIQVSKTGKIVVEIVIPNNTIQADFKIVFGKIQAFKSIFKYQSPSNTFIQLRSLSVTPTVGSPMFFNIQSTKPLLKFVVQVLSRDTLVSSSILDGLQQKDFNFSIPGARNMAPEAQLIAYYVKLDGEIVLDSEFITVYGLFKDTVSIRFDKATAKPGDNITTTIKADPNSYVCMIGRDKSVSLLNKGNDITENTILNSFTPTMSNLNSKATDVKSFVTNSKYMMLTDATIYEYAAPTYPFYTTTFNYLGPFPGQTPSPGRQQTFAPYFPFPPQTLRPVPRIQPVQRIRKTFSETWIWFCSLTRGNGYVNITSVLPDTITSWVGSAFALNQDTGFSLSTSSAQITGFKDFFISMHFPYSVVRGEEISLQVDVFNYQSTGTGMAVMFILRKSNDFKNIVRSFDGSKHLISRTQTESSFVFPGEVTSVFFPIIPGTIGPIYIEVTAQSSTAWDGVRRQLLVEPEGIPQEHNTPVLLGVDKGHPRNKDVPISFPALVVSGSQRVRVSVTGDVMGPTLQNLEQLLRMPTGCGEQTMLGLAPDVFVSHYLTETNQLTKELEHKLKTYIEKGYQRELTFQRTDGSFSAFGNRDSAGSMWLSAFVAKTFSKAKRHIFIDNTVLEKTIYWMINQQSSDGSFPEPGRIIHKNMQGGSVNGQSLTAFVLIALQENVILTGPIHSRIVDALGKAQQYLERHISNVNDAYGLSIVSYALSVSGSLAFNRIFDKLNRLAIVKGNTKYWSKLPSSASNKYQSPIDIEMTAYALLIYARLKSTGDGSDVLRWLATQRNSNGGFVSTQDTVIALESLSEFNVLIRSQQPNMTVSVTAGSQVKHFTVNTVKALVLQAAELQQPFPSQVQILASGHGIALVDVAVFYNVEKEHRKRELPSFDISIRILKQTIYLIELQICTRWLLGGSSGMTVQEIGIPTGFEAKTDEIALMREVKKIEEENKKVVLYFDEISQTPICITMKAIRTGLVSKLKPSAVRVYDYYEPEHQATKFYHLTVLQNSTVCDVCKLCRLCR